IEGYLPSCPRPSRARWLLSRMRRDAENRNTESATCVARARIDARPGPDAAPGGAGIAAHAARETDAAGAGAGDQADAAAADRHHPCGGAQPVPGAVFAPRSLSDGVAGRTAGGGGTGRVL